MRKFFWKVVLRNKKDGITLEDLFPPHFARNIKEAEYKIRMLLRRRRNGLQLGQNG